MAKDPKLREAKDLVSDNLREMHQTLVRCVEEGMVDTGDYFYNEILTLLDDISVIGGWGELEEIIAKAKTLEVDIAVWLSFHGRNTLSFPWPKP